MFHSCVFHSVRQNYSKTKWPEIMISINSSSEKRKNLFFKIVYAKRLNIPQSKFIQLDMWENGYRGLFETQIDDTRLLLLYLPFMFSEEEKNKTKFELVH